MNLSVVIPARNEAKNIGATLDALTSRLEQERINYEVVVVDDGSTDDTEAEVNRRCTKNERVRLVANTGLHGFGRAVRKGLEEFTGDAVIIYMADASDDPDDVVRYFYALRDEAECVLGSRFIRGSRVYNYPIIKLVLNRTANLFISALFGLPYNDITNAFKGYRANVIRGCQPLLSPHFNLTVELPLKAIVRGYTYKVLPISWRNRRFGMSSLHIQEMGSRYLYIVLNVWLERLLTRDDFRRNDRQTEGAADLSVPSGPATR
jgi:dolichol-phosphate mannosyltransferase